VNEACPFCGSQNARIAYRLTGFQIGVCADCNFEYHAGFRGGGGDEGMFSEKYYLEQHHAAFHPQLEDYMQDPSAQVFQRWLRRIEEKLPVGRILDVGSALGTFLKISERRGWAPQGVEISRFAAEFAREKRDIPIFNGDLEDFPCENETFDVVTFWDSLEHVTHPLENLKKAARLIRKGGCVLVATDNYDCLLSDTARLAYRLSLGKIRYPMERIFIDRNRSYFTESTLRAFLKACGLNILFLEKMEYPLDKIPTNRAERLILRGFYGAARLLGREAQVTVLAEKL
jgi:2-polyprenyl-3-methyl-5-hydroxy-6-metoxy-1,4-benzoquinol methylase